MSLSQYLAKGKGPGSKAGSVVSGYTRGGGGGAREKKRAGFAIQEEAEVRTRTILHSWERLE